MSATLESLVAQPAKQKASPFTVDFQKISVREIVDAVRRDGYYSFERAITTDSIENMHRDLGEKKVNVNNNDLYPVFYHEQFFFTQAMAGSKTCFDLITHDRILEIAEGVLGENYRLRSHRYYETFGTHHMQWHTDNKTTGGYAGFAGLVFIFYLSDVEAGEFQYIKGSQHWSGKDGKNDYTDAFIDQNHSSEVVGFKMPRGSFLVCHSNGIHRAKPMSRRDGSRTSLYFQIDNQIQDGEKFYLNTTFLDNLTERVGKYLGFGTAGDYITYPPSAVETLPLGQFLNLQGILLKGLLKRAALSAFRSLPQSLRFAVKGKISS